LQTQRDLVGRDGVVLGEADERALAAGLVAEEIQR